MVVMIMESVPVSLRGELSRWLIEPHPGVFLGHLTAMVRDRLWDRACASCRDGGLIQMWTTNNEQRFAVRGVWEYPARDCRYGWAAVGKAPLGKRRKTGESSNAKERT